MTEQEYMYRTENRLKKVAYDGDKGAQTLLAIKRNSLPTFSAIVNLLKALDDGRAKGYNFGKAEVLLAALIGEVATDLIEKERSLAAEECKNLAETLRKNLP